MYYYFVVFSANGGKILGNGEYSINSKINSYNEINVLSNEIMGKNNYRNVVITNYILLRDDCGEN